MTNRTAGNKYIIGWTRLDPKNRNAFMHAARHYAKTCRAEEGCSIPNRSRHNQLSGALPTS
ncbi:MAG: hypothetical protein GKR98_01780 [Boseongicola sp.]|nr:MAG: hypothetical protein GKR98_01780 [Boseongicola sp.]